ncbi:MAG: response regulator [Halobacteria archaeon]
MSQEDSEQPKILIVDDDKDVATMYDTLLAQEYETVVSYGGEECLGEIDETVDIVLLDRRMPGMSGDEVLDEIRNERDISPKVILLTAVNPDYDIIELDFDNYITKPVDKKSLTEAIDKAVEMRSNTEKENKLAVLSEKKDALESTKTETDLKQNDKYQKLKREVEKLRHELE